MCSTVASLQGVNRSVAVFHSCFIKKLLKVIKICSRRGHTHADTHAHVHTNAAHKEMF